MSSNSIKGTAECNRVCVADRDCNNSNDCDAGWMCNFDDRTSGFCETCADKTSIELCDDANFSNVRGFTECTNVCVPKNPYAPSA